jgi:anaerobic selenocysteine-containing dehydrogenase
MYPKTASARGIKDGDRMKVKSSIGEIATKAHVTESIVPGTVAISYHCGHWAWGGYASGKACKDNYGHVCESDCHNKWWGKNSKDKGPTVWRDGRGVHVNWIIPNVGDPIGGGLRWMDTVVKVTRA